MRIKNSLIYISHSLVLSLSHSYIFSLSLFLSLINNYIIYRTRTSSRTRDRLRSYCFWIPRLPWEHPIGTISCKYQSYSGWERAERDAGSFETRYKFSFFFLNFFFGVGLYYGQLALSQYVQYQYIYMRVIGKVKGSPYITYILKVSRPFLLSTRTIPLRPGFIFGFPL